MQTMVTSLSAGNKARPIRQRGQALTEIVLILLLVLIPLFVFNWYLNAHYNARTTALSAARYAAWERTVWFEPKAENANARSIVPYENGDARAKE